MEMAKQRADELGTRVLWCDGGEGGLSGIVGMGESSVQVGRGTWVQRLSFELPLNEKRTVFGTVGALWGLILAWGFALGNIPRGNISQLTQSGALRVQDRITGLFRRKTQPVPNLLDD